MPPDDEWTIRRLLAWTTDFLGRKGSDSPRLDAEVMLAHVLGYERVRLYTHHEEIVGDRGRTEFRELVRRRSEGAPVAYLVGRKEFYSLRFDVTPAVLIPRPETEFVVIEFLDAVKEIEEPSAVDVGTGSGCIAVACARHKPGARFLAVDLSPEALEVAARNAERHGVAERIEFMRGDLLAPAAGRGPFDVVVSNPPYIATAEVDRLDPSVKDYEPRAALDGGPDGLSAYRRLVAQAAPLLKPGGRLILEIGHDQEEAIGAIIAESGAFEPLPTVRDLQSHPRVARAARTSRPCATLP
ncbi:peptide chain release factor N(5)-glutamine methyltransferase [Paludisphaera sp.]|uniref:peptide chain release factor N(5)-glutamine methyltransferase n=1 Tax=Paludisphaera sp. TaxID=2017432 RepID=UPI00301CD0EE